jgi:hypothetical protein
MNSGAHLSLKMLDTCAIELRRIMRISCREYFGNRARALRIRWFDDVATDH